MSKHLLIPFLSLFAVTSHAQDLSSFVNKPLINESEQGFTYERHQLCDGLQVSYQAHGVNISPNFFLLVNGMVEGQMIADLRRRDCTNISNPIGSPDVVLKADMSEDGFKLSFTDYKNDRQQSKSMIWQDFTTKGLMK